MTSSAADEPPRRSPHAEWVLLDGQAAIHDHAEHRYHVLDAIATAVWVRLDGRTLAEVAADLAREFDADVEVIRGDAERLVEDLRARGLVDATAEEPTTPRWLRAPGTVWRQTARGTLVLATGDEPTLLGGGAVPLWALLDGPHTTELLASVLAEAAGADVDTVSADVATTLADLEARGLVTRA